METLIRGGFPHYVLPGSVILVPVILTRQWTCKTDKSKRYLYSFGGKLLMDEKSPPLFLGRFSFQPIIFFVFFFSFSLFQRIGLENAVEGSLWGSIWSIQRQKSTLRYVNITTNNLLWWSRATYNATINIL
jgi:hypothetical protein